MKKWLRTGVVAALAFTMAVAGCAGGDTDDDVSPDDIEDTGEELESGNVALTVWAEEGGVDFMNQLIESFKQEYAGQAEFEFTVIEQNDSKTKDVFLGDVHNGADVFVIPDDQLLSMVAAGVLSPVVNAEEVKAANLEEAISAATYNDIVYAYPYTADNGYFLYYDKNYYSESDVQTMDSILAVAEQAGKQVSMELNSGWYLYTFFGGTGLDFGLNEDGVTNHCNWNTTEGNIKGTDIAQALLDITGSSAFVAQADAGFIEGVQNGTAIAGVSGTWNSTKIKEAWGDYGACKLPTYTVAGQQIQMTSFTGYKMMGVNSYSEYEEWAHKFAEWITNEENQTLRFEVRSQGPSNINAAASDAVSEVPAIQAVIDQSQFGTLQRVGNNYWDPCTEFAEIVAAGNPDNTPLQELMDNLVNGITASTVQ